MNSPQDDPYEILGISRQASDTQIKAAYRKLALRYHPDKNPASSSHAQFTQVSHAYETLRDPQLRAQYDRSQQQQQQSQQQPYSSFGRPAGRAGFHDPFQVFQQVFAEEFGGGSSSSTFRNRSSMNRSSQRMSSIFDHDDSLFNDPFFSDPFLGGRGPRQSSSSSSSIRRRDSTNNNSNQQQQQERTNSRGMGPFMGSPFGSMFNGGGGSLFDRFDDMMDSMQRDMEQQQQQQQGNSNSGHRSYSSSSYYSSSSTSSNNNGSRGETVTTQTTRRIVNGQEHVLKERIVHKADGSVERQVLEDSTSSRPYTNPYSLEQHPEQPALPSSSDNNTSPESDTPSFWQRRFSRSKDGHSRHTTGSRPPSHHPTNEDSDPKRKRTT